MAFDAICLRATLAELSPALVGAKIDKVQQPTSDTLYFAVRTHIGNRRLLINTGAHAPRIQFTDATRENPAQPPMFCMLLRKYLVGARIAEVAQPGGDRVVRFELICTDELGDSARRSLVVELMGRYANVILLDADGVILDCLRRVDAEMSPIRQLLPGLYYHAPALFDKLSLEDSDETRVGEILRAGETLTDKLLLAKFAWLSPLVCRELIARSKGSALLLERELYDLRAAVLENRYTPTMVLEQRRDPCGRETQICVDYSYLPITQYGNLRETRAFESFSALLDAFYAAREAEEHRVQRSQGVRKVVSGARTKLIKKLAAQQQELSGAEDRDKYRRAGDLIMANIWKLDRGMSEAVVTDYMAEGCPEVTIKLDPRYSPQDNAQKQYKAYTRQKRAEEMLKKMIAEGEDELVYLDSVLDALTRCNSEAELAAIRTELAANGYASQKWAASGKKQREKPVAPLHYAAPDGFDVYVGRNNTQNEQLTLKTAAKSDWWFHVQKAAGAHVILACEGQTPSDSVLEYAARLAAGHSAAATGGLVAVDYTQIRNVRKQPGGKTGMVLYTSYKTAYVQPAED
ncbi:MAG: NFACT RNA binding domain-containing protein [Clostridiaceae bacterium]|nr:NFACT RNA binding domain-containing protein [Clostridiaceae bacterium]